MTTQKPTDLKSVSLEQVKIQDGKTVVGGADSESASHGAKRDLNKLEKVGRKVDRDDGGPVSEKKDEDSEEARKDSSKRIDLGLPPYRPA
ncbi:MAG TPA: hypothetical protein VF535_08525 [Allosphingosinicella sp.]|jgi:hypothetical protein